MRGLRRRLRSTRNVMDPEVLYSALDLSTSVTGFDRTARTLRLRHPIHKCDTQMRQHDHARGGRRSAGSSGCTPGCERWKTWKWRLRQEQEELEVMDTSLV